MSPEVSERELESLAGLLTHRCFAELEERASELLAIWPHAGLLWQFLAVARSQQGKDAVQEWMATVRCIPGHSSAHLNLGNALGRAGRLEEAAASYRRALALQPEFAEAHNNLGEVELDLGQLTHAEASFRRATHIKPDWADALRNLGKTLLRCGHYGDALGCCQRAVQLGPDSAEAHNSLGNALCRLGRAADALVSFRRALALQPAFVEAHANLANALRSMGRVEEAVEAYRTAIRLQPDFVPAYIELATALRVQRRTTEAEAACREALRLAPNSASALIVLAELRADEGCFSAAEGLLERAVCVDPRSVEGRAALPRMRRMTSGDSAWLAAAQELLAIGQTPQREITLNYAMGKYFDDVGEFSQAFLHFERANELTKLCSPRHDRQQLTRAFDRIMDAHDSEWIRQQRALIDHPNPHPVFIVGMLRSGTTLVEQILASHPAVAGAGELPFWTGELARLLDEPATPTAQPLRMDGNGLSQAALDYLRLLAQHSQAAVLVVDKMPTNFLALGLIHAAFPHARIISMLRDPLDTCLSIYFQHFEAANTYTHDLGDLAHYFVEYERLMGHWRTLLPNGSMLDVPYEELVAEPEKWTRRLLDFIGVPWDSRCLEFYRGGRSVVTASKWQVRQPLSTSSVKRWLRYEQFIGPLKGLAGRG